MRIVSLLPSATEIICRLGLENELVGVTHECDYPASVAELPKVTRTLIPHTATSRQIDELVRDQLDSQDALYTLDMPVLERLRPDVIVTQALCDVCAVAESEVMAAACALPGSPQVVNLEPTCLEEVFDCISLVGEATGRTTQASLVIAELRGRVNAVSKRASSLTSRPRVAILEWIDPPFCCGHWSPELVRIAGGQEVLGRERQPSQTISWAAIRQADPEWLILACCGFGIERTLVDLPTLTSAPGWSELACVRAGQVFAVDGSAYFSRPGPRLVDSLEILAHALDPERHPLPVGLPATRSVELTGTAGT